MADAQSKEYLQQNNFSEFLGKSQTLREFQTKEIERESRLVNAFKIPKL